MSHTYLTLEESLSLRRTRSRRSLGIAVLLFGFVLVMYVVSVGHIEREMKGATSAVAIEKGLPATAISD